ncbi:N-acetylmuramoyl-L-alanine amidase [Paludicola sp. MB14-C6]|uniref:N-acetylmuramoyl-L-alanine amidase family protein n=1 Tax=Paludihabitans sp. MB14-C6 TaxID=3070656 RepID=UPI0027DBB53C|nr:N-acetylmuramoyl-L-alanine amidase [Paludicola sp. MB14-C6]WMJ24463.1 N-acetylmuramoyl-L-alanine amidase [Paludicola sp. MB14-C6]
MKKQKKFFRKDKNKSQKKSKEQETAKIEDSTDSNPIKKPVKKMTKNKKIAMIIGIIITAVLIILSVVLGIFLVQKENKAKQAVVMQQARIKVPEGYFKKVSVDYTFLKKMKALKLTPKTDLYADINATQAQLESEVDAILKDMKTLDFNTIIIDTKYDDKVIFKNELVESTPVDLLSILIEKAKAQNISVQAIYNVTGLKTTAGSKLDSHLPYENKEMIFDVATHLAKTYPLDSILIDSYYSKKDTNSYHEFMRYGGIGNYDQWLLDNALATIDGVSQAIKAIQNKMAVGLVVDSVWANKADNEKGLNTKAEFTALKSGFADTKAILESKCIDYINIKATTSIEDPNVSYTNVVTWWNELCKQTQNPFYVTHSGEKANQNLPGWNGYGQLAKQVSAATKLNPQYYGSAFTGYKSLMANMETSTQDLLKYYKDEYSENDLFQNLTLSLPKKTQFVTYEEAVQFRGKFDPNHDVILNGEKVKPSEKGGFSVWVNLEVGVNKIVMEHKGEKQTFTIERQVIPIKSVSPTKAMKVAGGSTIEINVMAYKGAKVTATLGGKTITLAEGGAGEDNEVDSTYRNFQGSITVGAAKNKEQNIGAISVKGTFKMYSKTLTGSTITIDKIPDDVDPDAATGKVLPHAVVTQRYANTYPYLTTPGYPQAILYQLPSGTQDIVESVNGDFVNLRSGKTVKRGAVSIQDIAFEGNNAITAMTAGVEGGDTVIRATMSWKAPFSILPNPYPTDPSQTKNYSFSSNQIILLFDYTTVIDKNAIAAVTNNITSSPLFSGASFERVFNQSRRIFQYKLTLNLSKAGSYYGCHATYEGNTLVLRFNNPASGGSLAGITIAIDPGHGGNDNGTMAGQDTVEKTVNLIMAEKVKAELQALGANVIMTRTGDSNPSLDQRVLTAHNNQVDMMISCHHNSAGSNASANGVETYFNAPFSQPLAQHVQARLGQHLYNRGFKCSVPNYNFVVTREKQFPSILIEYGYLSNPEEEQKILDPTHQDNMAKATAQGVLDYYNALR